jgi:ATP-dependent exoDNAse (exonuclease V) beta subunit
MDSKEDLIINVENEFVKKTKIGSIGICSIPDEYITQNLNNFCNNIFLKTKFKEFLWLKNKKIYKIECDKKIMTVWLCKIITLEDLLNQNSSITIKEEEIINNNLKNNIEVINIIYGRCENSMIFLDKVYRDYIYRHKFKNNEIVAIKSVAGSGKTTTLLELSKIHNNKKILYIAFNKSLISEIKDKIKNQSITNLIPITFDALMREVFIHKTGIYPSIVDLKPQNIGEYIDWFSNKPYRIKNFYIKNFSKFCNQIEFNEIADFSKKKLGDEKKLLNTIWQKSINLEIITFDSIRKLVERNNWCKDYIDNLYDLIFVDESQDFDNTMLKILLEDTTIPKLFVGDPKQAIYEWKGCINAFDKLPESSLIIEFYSTFRVGLPACNEICMKFSNCWMISKSINMTNILYDVEPDKSYVYLFRNWKNLLQTAQSIPNIWIHNFDSQIDFIKKLHKKLQISNLDEEELNEFSDDLPLFLLKLSLEDLEKLINNIENNIKDKDIANVKFYTIHSYKGLEDDIIRIFNDIDIKKDENLFYVALTRGKKEIILDTKLNLYDNPSDNKKQSLINHYGIKKITQSKRKKETLTL